MATRRDKDLPSHPSITARGRPRIPEREVTTTDVTQHATEILTDQDFLITNPQEGDYFRHDGADWVNVAGIPTGDILEAHVTQHQAALSIAFTQLTGSIAEGQVPEAVVTQHQAALAIAASQVTAGTFGTGLDNFSFSNAILVSGIGRFGDGTHDNPALAFLSDTDLGFYKATTGGMGLSAEFFALNSQSATGSPYISWRQNGTERAYIQWNDSATRLRFSASEAGASMDWLVGGTIAMQYKNNDLTNVLGDVVATN